MARAIVGLGHELGLEVVAEGIETEVERALARTLGCDVMQGYLLGHPVPPGCIDGTLTPGMAGPALEQLSDPRLPA